MKRLIVLVMLVIMFAGCSVKEESVCNADKFSYECSTINSENLIDHLEDDNTLFLDIREESEYLTEHIKGFENVPFRSVIFNAEAGSDPSMTQLFGGTVDNPQAVYENSVEELEMIFPRDTTIILMCQSGNRVQQCMTLLEALGWDMSFIYNVGGMNHYTDSSYNEWKISE